MLALVADVTLTACPNMYSLLLLLSFIPPSELCFTSDVKAYCCPAACGVKNSPKWYDADKVLRTCMKSLGCGSSDSTVNMTCNCKK